MTAKFTPYQFQELATERKQPEVPGYESPVFEAHPTTLVAKTSSERAPHFRLDHTVASQLGLERQEKKAFDEKVAQEIERRWQIAKEKAEVEGYTAGLEEGKKEAFKAEQPRILERFQKMDRLLQEWDKMRERIFLDNEAFLMDLIGRIARMIVLKEVELDREYIHRVVIALLGQVGTKDDIKVFISPEDSKVVDSLRQSIEKEFGKLSNLSLEVGKDLAPSSCKVETRFGVIDASLQVQVENVMKALRG